MAPISLPACVFLFISQSGVGTFKVKDNIKRSEHNKAQRPPSWKPLSLRGEVLTLSLAFLHHGLGKRGMTKGKGEWVGGWRGGGSGHQPQFSSIKCTMVFCVG
uniref:PPUP8151 n=1 Tax=Poeciliopsis prolifica TaxID=188132 RepID=A0A0S7EQM4_9TELE